MAYVPNNGNIYTAVYAGALAGMAVSGRRLTSNNSADYDKAAAIAGAFAQEFDTLYHPATADDLNVLELQQAVAGYWAERYPNVSSFTSDPTDPTEYETQCLALIAQLTAAYDYYAAQGITPPPFNTPFVPPTGTGFVTVTAGAIDAASLQYADVVSSGGKAILQQVSGGDGGHAGRVGMNAGAYFSWDAFATQATAGDLRWGDVDSTIRTLLSSRNSTNTTNRSILSTDGFGTQVFGSPGSFQALGTGSVTMNASAGYNLGVNNSASLVSFAINVFSYGSVSGAFTHAYDASCTEKDESINAIVLTQLTPNKWNPKKGQRNAVTVISDADYTLLTTDYFAALADTPTANHTFTLPASPSAGDTYEISVGALNGKTLTVSGNTANINGNATLPMSGDYSNLRVTFISAGAGWRTT